MFALIKQTNENALWATALIQFPLWACFLYSFKHKYLVVWFFSSMQFELTKPLLRALESHNCEVHLTESRIRPNIFSVISIYALWKSQTLNWEFNTPHREQILHMKLSLLFVLYNEFVLELGPASTLAVRVIWTQQWPMSFPSALKHLLSCLVWPSCYVRSWGLSQLARTFAALGFGTPSR